MQIKTSQKLNSFLMVALLLMPQMLFGQSLFSKNNNQTQTEINANETLPLFTYNLSEMATKGKLNYTEGFDKPTKELLQSLSSKKSTNIN